MHERIIIADTSALIALSNINGLSILHEVYGEVLITPQVSEEFGDTLPNWIRLAQVNDQQKIALLRLELDLGEASAIALAMEYPNSTLIIDEHKGRAIAKKLGIKITGILGVVLKAKELGAIDSVKALISKLETVHFRIAPNLKAKILALAGED